MISALWARRARWGSEASAAIPGLLALKDLRAIELALCQRVAPYIPSTRHPILLTDRGFATVDLFRVLQFPSLNWRTHGRAIPLGWVTARKDSVYWGVEGAAANDTTDTMTQWGTAQA